MIRQLLLAGMFVVTTQGAAYAQQCLHGSTETDAEKERRTSAVNLARQINTAQHRYRQQTGRFGSLQEIAAHVQKAYPKNPKVSSSGELQGLAGFEVKLLVEATRYVLQIKDTTDPCSFAFWTDDDGVILQSYPIDSRFWREGR